MPLDQEQQKNQQQHPNQSKNQQKDPKQPKNQQKTKSRTQSNKSTSTTPNWLPLCEYIGIYYSKKRANLTFRNLYSTTSKYNHDKS